MTEENNQDKTRKKRLIVIDANAVIHRAFHALPPLTTKAGEPINAVYGFFLVFFRAIRDFQPDFIAAVFDFPAPTFRHQEYKLYKAKRKKAPDELYRQIPRVKEILKVFNVPIFEKQGFEADDLIGLLARKAPKKQVLPELETIIVTGDSDALQLVDKNTKVFALRRGIKDAVLYDREKVKEKYQGLEPEQLIDFKSLRGDPSDNIPGVFGVGQKTAIDLIKKFGSLENLYQELKRNGEMAGEIKDSLRQKLLDQEEQAFISKSLVRLKTEAEVDFELEKCCWPRYNKDKAIEVLKNYQFQSLIKRNVLEKEKK